MSVKKLSRSALNDWVEAVIQKRGVVGVQAKGDRFAYDRLCSAADLRLDYDVTILPPKKFFLPPQETLMTFNEEGAYQPVSDAEPFVLFGVHPYDVVAISQMDKVFTEGQYDTHYMERREGATIVACDVQTPSENVFAGCMDTAVVQEGFDVLLTLVGDEYVVDARTAKGEELLGLAGDAPDADAACLKGRERVWQEATSLLSKHSLKCKPDELPELLGGAYEHPVWEERAGKCYSCGSCVMVCPTCYCFDVQDDTNWDLKSGSRVRSWDGCQQPDFATVAGAHNFRKSREERYRHRFYRKGKYQWDRMRQIACVGCGRCTSACTTNIANPVEVYNALLEENR